MAITFLKLNVFNPADMEKKKELEFLIDSGAVYTVIPEEELSSLGIRPTSSEEFILPMERSSRSLLGMPALSIKVRYVQRLWCLESQRYFCWGQRPLRL